MSNLYESIETKGHMKSRHIPMMSPTNGFFLWICQKELLLETMIVNIGFFNCIYFHKNLFANWTVTSVVQSVLLKMYLIIWMILSLGMMVLVVRATFKEKMNIDHFYHLFLWRILLTPFACGWLESESIYVQWMQWFMLLGMSFLLLAWLWYKQRGSPPFHSIFTGGAVFLLAPFLVNLLTENPSVFLGQDTLGFLTFLFFVLSLLGILQSAAHRQKWLLAWTGLLINGLFLYTYPVAQFALFYLSFVLMLWIHLRSIACPHHWAASMLTVFMIGLIYITPFLSFLPKTTGKYLFVYFLTWMFFFHVIKRSVTRMKKNAVDAFPLISKGDSII